MESLYLLIPVSALLVLGILGVFGWAVGRAPVVIIHIQFHA